MIRFLGWTFLALLVVGALGALALVAGYRNAVAEPRIEEVELVLRGLPPGTRLTAILLSDTHAGKPDMPSARLKAVARAITASKPDLILLAGDYMGGKTLDLPPTDLEKALAPLQNLRAPLGVWASLGNHDSGRFTAPTLATFPQIRALVNANVDVGPLIVAGIESHARRHDIARTLAGLPPRKPVLLLAHEPGSVLLWSRDRAGPADIVVLSGHTHGGQVVLPVLGALAGDAVGPSGCLRGWCDANGWRLYITSGVGTAHLPIRFGVPPEIVRLAIRSPDQAASQASGRKSGTER